MTYRHSRKIRHEEYKDAVCIREGELAFYVSVVYIELFRWREGALCKVNFFRTRTVYICILLSEYTAVYSNAELFFKLDFRVLYTARSDIKFYFLCKHKAGVSRLDVISTSQRVCFNKNFEPLVLTTANTQFIIDTYTSISR